MTVFLKQLDKTRNFFIQAYCCCLVAKLCLILCDSMDSTPQAPLSMECPRQEYWNGLTFLHQGILLIQGLNLHLLQELTGRFFITEPLAICINSMGK